MQYLSDRWRHRTRPTPPDPCIVKWLAACSAAGRCCSAQLIAADRPRQHQLINALQTWQMPAQAFRKPPDVGGG